MTFLPSRLQGHWFYLYLILDLFSRKGVGFEAHETDQAEHAAHLVRRTALAGGIHARALRPVLHGDNGPTMKGTTVLAMLYWLGIAPSHSRLRVSDDNAYAEALFRTAKYRPDFPTAGFANLAAARIWAAAFVRWYNHEHRHSGIRYVTPAQCHAGEDQPVLAARHALYQQALAANPRRWSGCTRNWAPIGAVTLNPARDRVVAAVSEQLLSSSTDHPAFPSRPGVPTATARSDGDGRRGAARSHAQRSEHGEDGEHRTFTAASTVVALHAVGADAHPPKPGQESSLRTTRDNCDDTHRSLQVILAKNSSDASTHAGSWHRPSHFFNIERDIPETHLTKRRNRI